MFIRVVPAIRTIPGIESFDYAIPDVHTLRVGDVLRVPLRRQEVPAVVIDIMHDSPFASRARLIAEPLVLLNAGQEFVTLLREAVHMSFTSSPSVLASWLRHVPVRAKPIIIPPSSQQTSLPSLPETHFAIDRVHDATHGILAILKKTEGRKIILTPWKERSEHLGQLLKAPILHAGIAPGITWNILRTFLEDPNGILVSTRLGAWMGIVSDTIIVEEPENDDFKQDEMAPRLDARRIIETIHTLKPSIRIFRISTTPSLEEGKTTSWNAVPQLTPNIRLEPTTRQGRSPVANLSAQTLHEIHEAADNGNPVIIVHPIRGERARVTCRDCAWQAHCPACGFPVSLVADTELCRRCGKRSPVSLNCPACGGLDLSRGRAGIDTLSRDLVKHIGTSNIHVLNIPEWEAAHLTPNTLVVITDLSLFAGAIEDIRRRERLVIAWRRSAARLMTANARAIIQGGEELLQECRSWLTNAGVSAVWEQEWQERGSFRFPPAIRLVKILVDGEANKAEELMAVLEPTLGPIMSLRGPYPVPFRPRSRLPRHVIHLIAPKETPYSTLATLLAPIVGKAHIDLDPINCFS